MTAPLLSGLALAALLALGSSQAPPSSSAPLVELEGLDGVRRSVPLEGLALAELGPDAALLRFTGEPGLAPGLTAGFELHLRSRDRVRGQVVGGSEERLDLALVGDLRAGFDLEQLARLVALEELDRLAQLPPPAAGDRVWRRTSGGYDPLDGFLLGFSTEGLLFEGELGERLIGWGELAALHIEALEPLTDEAGTDRVAVDLVDGSRLRGGFRGLADGVLRLDRGGPEPLDIGQELLTQVVLDDPRLVFLGDLAYESLGPAGLFGDDYGLAWPPRLDRSVDGAVLRVGGRPFARGLGVHAPSRLAFDLPPGGTLRGAVGVDDSVLALPAVGSVIFRLHWRDAVVWESPELSSGDAPLELPALDLGQGGRLELEVDPASDSIMGDRADWLGLRIVRPEAP